MGRAIFLVFFFIAFAIFAIGKLAFVGVKSAYDTVFETKDAKVERYLSEARNFITYQLATYGKDRASVIATIKQLVPAITAMGQRHGFSLSPDKVKLLLARLVSERGIAREEEVLQWLR